MDGFECGGWLSIIIRTDINLESAYAAIAHVKMTHELVYAIDQSTEIPANIQEFIGESKELSTAQVSDYH